MTSMTHRARIEASISGETVDRPPVALWRHFPVDDQAPHQLAQAHINFQKRFDFDLLKVTPESTYMTKEWGGSDSWRGAPEGTREYDVRGVEAVEGWGALSALDPTAGRLGDQVTALRAIVSALGPDTPVIMTVFSPLTQARKLAGERRLLAHMRRHPDAVLEALETIAQTTVDFIGEIQKTGIAGIFYALQFAQYSLVSEKEFETFCLPYHEQVLGAASDMWLNVLHLHGNEVMFEKMAGLPVQVINWHDQETAPDLPGGQAGFSGAVCGGLRQWETMVYGDPGLVRAEAEAAIAAAGPGRFILGTGCVTPIIAPDSNLMAARRSVEEE